jgi:phage terminase large subunit-like protein
MSSLEEISYLIAAHAACSPGAHIALVTPDRMTINYLISNPGGVISQGGRGGVYHQASSLLALDNGSTVRGFVSTQPEDLRGASFNYGFFIRASKVGPKYELEAYENLRLATRLGRNPIVYMLEWT